MACEKQLKPGRYERPPRGGHPSVRRDPQPEAFLWDRHFCPFFVCLEPIPLHGNDRLKYERPSDPICDRFKNLVLAYRDPDWIHYIVGSAQ